MATELRLCDEDQKQYAPEGAPEWVTFDRDMLEDVPFDEQHAWEMEIKRQHPGASLLQIILSEFPSFSALGIKGVVWLAWKMAGLDTPKFKDFNIKTMKVRYATPDAAEPESDIDEGDDADPPSDGSSEPSSETATSSPA